MRYVVVMKWPDGVEGCDVVGGYVTAWIYGVRDDGVGGLVVMCCTPFWGRVFIPDVDGRVRDT